MKTHNVCSAPFLLLLASLVAAGEAPRTTVTPKDTGLALVNPDMGWCLHFYDNSITNYGSKLAPSDTVDDFPGLSTVYLRCAWSYLEPEEGKYNWPLFDAPAQRFIAKGKKVAMRITASESQIRYATPKWVQDAGAKGVDYKQGSGKGGGPQPGGPLWDPDFLDPIFLDKLDRFLAAAGKRYDGNPNIAYIDVGTFGLWGEGHTLGSSRLNDEQTLAACKRHIDLHLKHFKKSLLCISDDMAGHNKPGRHFPITDYAISKGVTLRDDSILVKAPPFSWYHAEMAQEFWPRFPVILEHEHYGSSKSRGAWGGGSLLLKAVEEYHASYMSIHGWPRDVLTENRAVIDQINRRMGYRLQLRRLAWPQEVALSQPFKVDAEWANGGVAPCYPGGFWAITLKDDKGGIVSLHVDEGLDMRTLKVGPPDKAPLQKASLSCTVALHHVDPRRSSSPAIKAGTCDVFVSVGQRDGTPTFALPLPDDDGQHRYKLGRIRLTEAAGK